MNQRSREKQARRIAGHIGLMLRKSRTASTWTVIDTKSGTVVAEGWELEQLEDYLRGRKEGA